MIFRRRATLVALAAGGLPALAQQPPRRIGVLAPSTTARETVTLKPFREHSPHP